ncbi:MAG: hypothetical protein LKJ47_07080 [Bifidobacteriaceae bacterium]|nr:hypothetical protein [Bifidobacteriaceae bacterium]
MNDDGSFVVDLSPFYNSLVSATGDDATYDGQQIAVVYDLKANANAEVKDLTNTFKVNNNGHEIPGDTVDPTDRTKVVDETQDLKKVNSKDAPLAGATFTLYLTDASGNKSTEVTSVLSGDANADGTVSPEEEAADTAGDIVFKNLGAGTYIIEETNAPAGYMNQSPAVKLVIGITETPSTDEETGVTTTTVAYDEAYTEVNDTYDLITLNATAGTPTDIKDANDNVIGTATVTGSGTIKNVTSVFQLPLTGAYGIALFLILAAILAGGAVVMVTVSKRNKKAGLAL